MTSHIIKSAMGKNKHFQNIWNMEGKDVKKILRLLTQKQYFGKLFSGTVHTVYVSIRVYIFGIAKIYRLISTRGSSI